MGIKKVGSEFLHADVLGTQAVSLWLNCALISHACI